MFVILGLVVFSGILITAFLPESINRQKAEVKEHKEDEEEEEEEVEEEAKDDEEGEEEQEEQEREEEERKLEENKEMEVRVSIEGSLILPHRI